MILAIYIYIFVTSTYFYKLSVCILFSFLHSVLRMGSMGGAPMMPGGGPDPAKVYKTEQDSPLFYSF